MSPIRLVFGAPIALAAALTFARVFAPVLADAPPPAAPPPSMADFECEKAWREINELPRNNCEDEERGWCKERQQVIDQKCVGFSSNRKQYAATILKRAAEKDCTRLWKNGVGPIAAKAGSCAGIETQCRRAYSLCADAENRAATGEIARLMAGRPPEPKNEPDVAKPPSPPPLPADAIAKCKPQFDRLVDAGLAKDGRAIDIYEQRFLAPGEKDCLRFLDGEAQKRNASLPPKSVDGLYEFACKMSGERCAAAQREKEEADRCRKAIDSLPVLRARRREFDDQETRIGESYKEIADRNRKLIDDEIAEEKKKIRASDVCRKMCIEDTACNKDLGLAAVPVPGPWPRLAFNDAGCALGSGEFWRFGISEKCLAAFAAALPPAVAAPTPAGAAPAGPASDPGFRRMCEQAHLNNAACEQRERHYRPDVRQDADRFEECRRLYSGVLDTCRRAGVASPATPAVAAPTPPTTRPPTRPTPTARQAQPATPAPTPPQPTMSAQCQKMVSDYVAAARANDGPRALAGYNALKRAGGCGVLQLVDRPQPKVAAPTANDPRFVARGATPNSDAVVGACDASPAECAARVRQLQQGTSPEAKAALFNHAVGVGIQLGTMMGQGMMMAVPPSAPRGSNMNSIGPGPVRNTYGPGSPQRPAPRTRQSDITGTK